MLFSILITAGLGIMVKYYKAYWLISGYNTMSKEKKKNVDVEGLANFMGNMTFIMAALMLLATILFMVDKEMLGGIALALFVPLSIYMIIKAQKYDGNTKNPDGTMKKRTKITVGAVSGFLILTTLGAGFLIYYSNKPAEFVLVDEYFQIKGIYGETIQIEDISYISLSDELPNIIFKNNGYSMGSIKKGNFKLESIGNAKLFVDTSVSPFIYIKRNDRFVILNCKEEKQTRKLFQELKEVVK
jgi:hypothetical protein